ncbi:hypothetical protein HZA71_01810 [Candidatus Falkowbacteria bacterium]|nr:hypothetical protein [Candidatus Falkowbacteria bacterium]
MNWLSGFFRGAATPNMIWLPFLYLSLLVLSAAISGLVVFGYPVYLLVNKQLGLAVKTILLTLLVLAVIIILGLIILLLFFR